MDQYPTEEEEYELMYADDLDAMDMEFENTQAPAPSTSFKTNPRASTAMSQNHPATMLNSPQYSVIDGESPLRSPALSQIPRDSSTIHRKLFGTPAQNMGRIASTPFPGPSTSNSALSEIQNLGLNPRKRRLDTLFGDIQDIEEEEMMISEEDFYLENAAKKTKNNEERDKEIIEQILEARKKFQMIVKPLKTTNIEKLEALHKFKMMNLSYSVPKWPFMTLIRSDSEKVYVRFHSEDFETDRINEINCFKEGYSGLLGDSKEKIWDEARVIILKKTEQQSKANEEQDCQIVDVAPKEQDLWVERYRPKRYLDLLSDETTNRSLLQWLKLWDKVVFKREPRKPKEQKGMNSFNKKTGKFEQFGWKRKNKNALNTDLDELGRPIQKIALLCGPPGLGKTTLAHTIARHAGYAVREVNASDDRSPEAFKLALENGTQMKSVLNEDKRPNCIILDEIDGAPAATIDFLIKFISGTAPQKGAGVKKGKAADKKFVLRRPIICICNDMYVPALRQLRQIAFVVNFPPTQSARLAERLLLIADEEHIKTDLTSLLALADKTGNDVRSCLGMLQFYNGLKKPLRLTDVLKSNVGQKDRHKSLFAVWSAIFQIQRPRKTLETDDVSSTEVVSMTDMSPATRMDNILNAIHMGGDNDRLMQGVFENYLHQKMPDPNMDGVAEAAEWFCFNDRLQQLINHKQNYSVYPYLSYGFVIWHFLFAGMAWPKITYPNKAYENSQKLATTKLILNALKKGLSAQIKGIGEGSVILLDTIPLLRRVLSPSLRSVSLQLLTSRERGDLTHTVEIMADFGLTYTQTKTTEGTYQYQLEPDIEHLGQFEGIASQNLSYFGKQIVAREVELEQMRRAQPKVSGPENPIREQVPAKRKEAVKSKAPTASENLPNHLRKLQPKAVLPKTKQVIAKDFFGRVTTTETALSVQEGGTDTIVKSPIWYRYKEGFNNAVRKDITMMDLM